MTAKTLEQRVRAAIEEHTTLCDACYPNSVCGNDTITVDEAVPIVADLCRAFAEEALRAAIVIERPYSDRSDLAVIVPGEKYERRKEFLSVMREIENEARESIIAAAAIKSAEGKTDE